MRKARKLQENYDESSYESAMRLVSENEEQLRDQEWDADMFKGILIITKVRYLMNQGRKAEEMALYKENRELILRTRERLKKIKSQ